MTLFEQYLIDKGYVKYTYDYQTKKLIPAKGHFLSTIGNLDHRYVHPDRPDKEIVFGLNECKKPPTLCWPRPEMKVEVIHDGLVHYMNIQYDDAMNRVLSLVPFDVIYKAMFNKYMTIRVKDSAWWVEIKGSALREFADSLP